MIDLDALDRNRLGVDLGPEGKRGENRELVRRVEAADVESRVRFGVAEPLSLAEADVERQVVGLHARQDVVAGAVEDAGDPLDRVSGQTLAQGLDDGYAAADRRLEKERRLVALRTGSASSKPCAASIALLAVTTGMPRASAALTASNATPSAPPINSTKTSMSAEAAIVGGAGEETPRRRDRRRARACGGRYRRRTHAFASRPREEPARCL